MKILIAAHCYAPSPAVGAKRPTGVALELLEQNHTPYVLTLKESCFIADSTLRPNKHIEQTTTRTACRSVWHHSKQWRNASNPFERCYLVAGKGIAKMTLRFCPIDDLAPWSSSTAKIGAKIALENNVDLIWATVPYMANSLLAFELYKRTHIPFVIDYRDLLDPEDQSDAMKHRRAIEAEILEHAAGISYVAPAQIVSLKAQHPVIENKPTKLVYNFFDDSNIEKETIEPSNPPFMIYGGSLYGGQRRMAGLIEALAKFTRQRNSNLVYKFYGPSVDHNYLSELATANNCANAIQLNGSTPQAVFNQRCREAAILVLSVGHGRKHEETIPGKLYDYFRAERPILALGPAGCDAGRLVEETNRGISVADDDVSGIAHAIELLLECKNRNNNCIDLSPSAVSKFARGPMVGNLVSFFEEIILNQSVNT